MKTNQTAPVTDEELDQMIWKLERDGMTPKMLSLMREVREVRRAKGEPVAWVRYCSDGTIDGPLMNYQIEDCRKSTWTPLYTTPPAPVVPDEIAVALIAAIEKEQDRLFGEDYMMDSKDCVDVIREEMERINACRAAMLQAGNSPVTPDGWVMVPVEPTYQMCQAMALSWESPRFPDRYKAMIEAAPDFRENVNSSIRYFREISETSTNCPKCGGRGTYHCPQMLGTVECECTLPAAPKEVG